MGATALIAYVALSTQSGQDVDGWATEALYARRATVTQILSLLGYLSIGSAGLALAACFFFGTLRGRLSTAIGAVVIVAGANITTQLLKRVVLDREDLGQGVHNSLPSGHTTLVTALVLAVLLVVPEALRYLTVLGGTFLVTMVGASTIVAGWHRPADVLAALAVSLAWGAAVSAVLGSRLDLWDARFTTLLALAVLGAMAAGAGLVAIGVRPIEGWSGVFEAGAVLGGMGLASILTIALFSRTVPR